MDRRVITSLYAAMRAVVYGYPEGAAQLAKRLGLRHHVLNNKLNPAMNHHLRLEQVIAIQRETRDCRILFEEARLLGYCCVPVETTAPGGDTDPLAAWMDWQAGLGQTAAAIKTALTNGRVTRTTLERIQLAMLQDMACEWNLFRHIVNHCHEPQAQAI